VSAQMSSWTLNEAGEARTAENHPAFLPQTLAVWTQTLCWPCNLPQELYNSIKPVTKEEIPAQLYSHDNGSTTKTGTLKTGNLGELPNRD